MKENLTLQEKQEIIKTADGDMTKVSMSYKRMKAFSEHNEIKNMTGLMITDLKITTISDKTKMEYINYIICLIFVIQSICTKELKFNA